MFKLLKNNYFLKLNNKIQKCGKKYKLYINQLNLLICILYLCKVLKYKLFNTRYIDRLDFEFSFNYPIFSKKEKNIYFLKSKKRQKESLKLVYILIYMQFFRCLKFRLLFIYFDLLFFFYNNLFFYIKINST